MLLVYFQHRLTPHTALLPLTVGFGYLCQRNHLANEHLCVALVNELHG